MTTATMTSPGASVWFVGRQRDRKLLPLALRQRMRLRPSICSFFALLVLACESGDADNPCRFAGPGVPETYSISLVEFPEVQGGWLDRDLHFSGHCDLDAMELEGDELSLSLSCDHPEGPVNVTITTAASGLPAGVEIGDSLLFEADAVVEAMVGGAPLQPDFRGLTASEWETYQLSDDDGLIFAAGVDTLRGNFGTIAVVSNSTCPNWTCDGHNSGEVEAYIEASTDEAEIDVHVGEVALLESGDLAWDVSVFQAKLNPECYHTEYGSFSIVRRP